MFNPVAPASNRVFANGRYRKSILVCVWLSDLDLSRHHPLYEEQRKPSSGSAWPVCEKKGKSVSHCWRREVSTPFAQQVVNKHTMSSGKSL